MSLAANDLARMPAEKRALFLAGLSKEEKAALFYRWDFWAREKQLAPAGGWLTWLILSGRGFGKTRTGAEWVRAKAHSMPGSHGALVARTAKDARDVMIEGESGILNISPPWFRPHYEPSKCRLTWPNGTVATAYSAEERSALRGPQFHWAWGDEAASWKDAAAEEGEETTYSMLQFGLRLGTSPQQCMTTTPKPVRLIRELLAKQGEDGGVVVTRGSSLENRANLAQVWFDQVIAPYVGTRLGRQEIDAEMLDDTPGALWTTGLIQQHRVNKAPDLVRIVVAVDPSISDGQQAAHTGIVVIGSDYRGHLYILEDCSLRGAPNAWATRAIRAYQDWRADAVVYETNQGGLMVEETLLNVARGSGEPIPRMIPVHSFRGKYLRAEPISGLYEQGMAHHVGYFAELESQMTTWIPGNKSPDRLDALVHGATELSAGMIPQGMASGQVRSSSGNLSPVSGVGGAMRPATGLDRVTGGLRTGV